MTIANINDYTQHLTTINPEAFLGHLLWFSVTEHTESYDRVKEIAESTNTTAFLSNRPPSDPDVFRRVTRNGVRRRVPTSNPNVTQNILVRLVADDQEHIVKRFVVEEVDAAGERLSYDEAFELRFDRNDPDHLQWRRILPQTSPLDISPVKDLLDSLAAEYQSNRNCVNGDGFRDIIKRALTGMYAVTVRDSGGVFFVNREQEEALRNLEHFSTHFPNVFVHSLPLLDDRKQLDLVRRAFEQEATGELNALLSEVNGCLERDSISLRKARALQIQYATLKRKVEAYAGLLAEQAHSAESQLRVLQRQMTPLLCKVGA